ncbi:hypothetical protein GFC01_05825 [Desulfofundulus thermobenzoicus]|uniref:Uncharacterized protein n=1 Tax=Desulfofundulus thermobenzoicus TaxID=29376 RepID=A0A6N7IRN1_9FIRM|nr:hypothetical protein [Desulfofundulus thermobenzoicus]MQL51788.1 hypothetical protein [Desulfofundulus thermobenzoicus]
MSDVKRKPEITEEDIWKEPVIAFLITKIPYYSKGPNGRERKYTVNCYPITFDWEGATSNDTGVELEEEERVLGIIPAPPESFLVTGFPPGENVAVKLGYEFSGAFNPDWKEELARKSKEKPTK